MADELVFRAGPAIHQKRMFPIFFDHLERFRRRYVTPQMFRVGFVSVAPRKCQRSRQTNREKTER